MASGMGLYQGEVGITLPGELVVTRRQHGWNEPWFTNNPWGDEGYTSVDDGLIGVLMNVAVHQVDQTWALMYDVLLPTVGQRGWFRGQYITVLEKIPDWDPFAREQNVKNWPPIYNGYGTRLVPKSWIHESLAHASHRI